MMDLMRFRFVSWSSRENCFCKMMNRKTKLSCTFCTTAYDSIPFSRRAMWIFLHYLSSSWICLFWRVQPWLAVCETNNKRRNDERNSSESILSVGRTSIVFPSGTWKQLSINTKATASSKTDRSL